MKVIHPVHILLGSKMCIQIDKKLNQVIIRKSPGEEKAFTYDSVYDWNST